MDKILQLLIDDFQNRKLSAEYKLVQLKVCEAEEKFMGLLSKAKGRVSEIRIYRGRTPFNRI